MRIMFLNLLVFGLMQTAFAQISGTFTTGSGQPIPFASVLLLNRSDSTLVKGSLSDEKGTYLLDQIRPGNYFLRLSSLGYQTWNSPVFELTADQNKKDFGVQIVKEGSKQLEEVVVRAEKPLFEQNNEGTVVNVENSVMTKGRSVLGVLERSPGVVIDYQNNGIALNGKTGVMVMLNGKLMRISLAQVVSLLNGMSANDVEKIELLTMPPSRYDAEGNAGLINIVTKKNKKQGTNGAFSITGGQGWGEKATGSVNLAHTTGKWNLYGSYLFLHDRTYNDLFIRSSQNMPVFGGQLNVIVRDTTKAVQNNHTGMFGLDFKINAKTGIGGTVNYNSNATSSTRYAHSIYTILPDSVLLFNGKVTGVNRWENLTSSGYIEKELKNGSKINVDADYLYFKNENPSYVQNTFLNEDGTQAGKSSSLFSPNQKSFAHTTLQVGVVKMDFSKQITKNSKLETGIKGTHTEGSSLSGIESLVDGKWISRSETSNTIVMQEQIGAGYVSFQSQLNPSSNLVIGFRYEYSRTQMDDPKTIENTIDRKLGAFFPNVSYSRKVNENAEWQFSYSKRISRPSYNDLASYVLYSDPTAVYTGNPSLKPTVSNTVKVGYTYRTYSFSLLYSRDDHPIARYQITERAARNLLYVSPQNLVYQNNLTFQTNIPWKVTNWWAMNYGLVGGLRQFKAIHTLKPVEISYMGYSMNFSQTFKLPKSLAIEISGWYNSESYNGSIKMSGFGSLNAGIKKDLKNKGGSFQLSVADLLRTLQINPYYGTLTEEAFSIKNHVQFNTESTRTPIFKLTYSRSFGSTGLKSSGQRNAGSNDEQGRVRKE